MNPPEIEEDLQRLKLMVTNLKGNPSQAAQVSPTPAPTPTPDTSTLAGKIAVMQAALEGRAIDSRTKGCGLYAWLPCRRPSWNWSELDFRIAPPPPTPRYRPWTADEIPLGSAIKMKHAAWKGLITAVAINEAVLGSDKSPTSTQILLDRFTLLDGTPCGTLEGGSQ